MSKDNSMERLKEQYDDIEVPQELDFIVRKTVKEQVKKNKMRRLKALGKSAGVSAAAVICLFVGSVNMSPALAQSLAQVPGIGALVEVVTIQEYHFEEGTYLADIEVPQVMGLQSSPLERELNEELSAKSEAQFQKFVEEMERMQGEGHFAVESNYEVKLDNDQILSFVIYNTETIASAAQTVQTYNIDKINGSMITLDRLFSSEQYIDVISDEIERQMREQMDKESNRRYFNEETEGGFEQINPNQNFYINEDGQIVIQFDEYEIAPGFMGAPTFVIDTELIEDLLLEPEILGNRG